MKRETRALIQALARNHRLTLAEYEALITQRDQEAADLLARYARETREAVYGTGVYIRGLIEISNICQNDCYYCGIRGSNPHCDRYRLTPEDILACCREGYALGFRTFVLQGGEDGYYTDGLLCALLGDIKKEFPDCAVTLSLGERSRASYQALFDAGADRYLLRHETADEDHYRALHPENLSFARRMECLRDLKAIGFQVGCGFMVSSPGQTPAMLAKDLKFIEEFQPDMCGIGPFIPHKDTPFRGHPAGTVELTCYLLSIIRLISPAILLPATTALGTIHPTGRELGMLSGANVVMPNLSPPAVREKYALYNNKLATGAESAQHLAELNQRMRSVGYHIVTHRGDRIKKL